MSTNERQKKWYAGHAEQERPKKAALMRKYRAENPDKHRALGREFRQRQRAKLFEIYGSVCVLCGFADVRALTLDHVLKNGAAERAQLGERGVYRRALLPEFRSEYRTLCMNCQFIARHPQQWLDAHGSA